MLFIKAISFAHNLFIDRKSCMNEPVHTRGGQCIKQRERAASDNGVPFIDSPMKKNRHCLLLNQEKKVYKTL